MPSDGADKEDRPISAVVEASPTAGRRVGGLAGGGGTRRGPPYLDTGHCRQHYNQETRTL